ncbi:MAG: hypothetical protein JWN41_1145, partial [Thermoleophilia bacterium]|nr:hypothetical protein [Thermoleophilia bacterium]
IFVERVKVSDEDRARLDELLRLLIDAPPELDSMLRQLVEFDQGHGVAELLVADLASIAKVDANIDHREETLLRMVCGAFGIAPRTLHAREMRAATEVETEELRQLVHALVAR